jgi:dTDP-4-amino-4,6-dideoxygalactose transaminase
VGSPADIRSLRLPPAPAHEEVPFNRPFVSGGERALIEQVLDQDYTAGNGPLADRCERLLREATAAERVLLTNSGTGALEMSALLIDIGPGDEVILPSFTFVSTANAFVLRGATPVFVDIEPETLGLDPARCAEAVGARTRAIVPVHYGGAAAEMDAIMAVARQAGAWVVEDAAQGAFAAYRGRPLGTIGELGVLSFHETKNLSCGEGGALLVNDPELVDRAEVFQEKGTNRLRFVRGEIGAYTWIDVGSSFLMSEFSAAVLLAQLEEAEYITGARREIWHAYHRAFADAEEAGILTRPLVPTHVHQNGHCYYVLARDGAARDRAIARLAEQHIRAQFHYVPLHSSPAGRRYGRTHGRLRQTDDIAARLLRMPMWIGLTIADIDRITCATVEALT